MLKRYWGVIYLAIGLSAGPVFGQQEPSGVSSEGPRTEEQGSGQGQAEPAPFPITIVETSEQADYAQSREAKSDQHEADDLAAQQRAADAADRAATAADRQIIPTWLQVAFAAIGSGLLIWTLVLNSQAARDAALAAENGRRAADAAEKAYLSDNRPWIKMELHRVEDFTPGKPVEVYVFLENLGKTPALDTKVWVKAVKVRIIQIDKSHVRKHVAECVRNAPHNTFQSAVILPTVKMVTREDAPTVDELDLPNGNKSGYWLGLLCVCTYRSTVSPPDKFFHTTMTLLVKPNANFGLNPWFAEHGRETVRAANFNIETISHVASIE